MTRISVDPHEIMKNPYTAIGKQWFLLSAGEQPKANLMTASWGQTGILWNLPVFTSYVRSNRFTYGMMEENDLFSVSFLTEDYRKALQFCGANSGRDGDKFQRAGLTPLALDGTTAVDEAELILICKKLYTQELDQKAMPQEIQTQFYGTDPMHTMYVGQILHAYQKK